MPRYVTQQLCGWGNFPVEPCRVFRPEKVSDERLTLAEGDAGDFIARGLGRSYGDSAVNAGGGVVLQARLNRFLGFELPGRTDAASGARFQNAGSAADVATRDPSSDAESGSSESLRTGIGGSAAVQLAPVQPAPRGAAARSSDVSRDGAILEAEGGVSFKEIIDLFLPRGFFLPVTPGTKFVTLGGAIAADVHGKNHHRHGSIGNFVLDLKLLTASGEVMHCSRQENADVFWATIGGMGLTGIILSARLRLAPVQTCYVNVDYRKAANLDAALDLFAGGDQQYAFSVAWIDCLAGGGSLGRSVLMRGNPAARDELPADLRPQPLRLPPRRTKSVPFNMPSIALNSLSVSFFNALFYRRHQERRKLVDFETFFYPLDSTLHWNRMYGKRGFIQYQPVFPPQCARQGLIELLEALTASRRASFLAVLKSFGPQGAGLLSFPLAGQTLALDLPNTGPDLLQFTRKLDAIVLKHGGRIYLAKDSCLEPATFAAMYPRLGEFQAIRRRVDPALKFNSSQARRLGMGGRP